MEKALEILKEIDEVVINKYHKNKDITFYENDILFIKEAISELEEAMKPKTCEGCKYQKIDIDRCDFCKRCYSDQYEPKDNA